MNLPVPELVEGVERSMRSKGLAKFGDELVIGRKDGTGLVEGSKESQ